MSEPIESDIHIKVHGKIVHTTTVETIRLALSVYPGENLYERKIFTESFLSGEIKLRELQEECKKIQIPWQLFILNKTSLSKELTRISKRRFAKFSKKLLVNRKGSNNKLPPRIVDRVIGLQEFCLKHDSYTNNGFLGSIKDLSVNEAAEVVMGSLDIDMHQMRSFSSKEKSLEYLIEALEKNQIRVSRGVLTNKILPEIKEMKKLYKKTSGFIVHDDSLPYLFLPSESNIEESPGRQIYSLLLLVVLAGMGDYTTLIEPNYLEGKSKKTTQHKKANGIVSEMLLPSSETAALDAANLDEAKVSSLSQKYKLTPTAVLITLKQRGLIEEDDLEALKTETRAAQSPPEHFNRPKVSTSVKKFCGDSTCSEIITAITTNRLPTVEAQYLLFGQIDKVKYQKFKSENSL